jgi:hypothetical protein
VEISSAEAQSLLRESGAFFLQYSSMPVKVPTEWWYIVCDSYDTDKLSSKMRNQIKRGRKGYAVARIDCRWLAKHGYQCYVSAFTRYAHARPLTAQEFQAELMATVDGPFEHWGIFQGDQLVGYGQFIVEDRDVLIDVVKFAPPHLRHYCAYALYDTVLRHYVGEAGLTVNDGNRPLAHDTRMHEHLLKYGFKKLYGALNVVYQPWLKWGVSVVFPFRRALMKAPSLRLGATLPALLLQEEIRRQCRTAR